MPRSKLGKKSTYQFTIQWKDYKEEDDDNYLLSYSKVKDVEALDTYISCVASRASVIGRRVWSDWQVWMSRE